MGSAESSVPAGSGISAEGLWAAARVAIPAIPARAKDFMMRDVVVLLDDGCGMCVCVCVCV